VRGRMSQHNNNVIQHDFKSHVKTVKEEPLILPLTIQQVSQLMNESKYIVQNWIRDLREYVPISKNQSGYNVFYEDGIKALLVIKSLHREKGYSIKQIDQYFKTNGEWFESAPEIPNVIVTTNKKEKAMKVKISNEQQGALVVPLFDKKDLSSEQDTKKEQGSTIKEENQETIVEESHEPIEEVPESIMEEMTETSIHHEVTQEKSPTTEQINASFDSSSLVNSINHLQKSIDELNQIITVYIQEPTPSDKNSQLKPETTYPENIPEITVFNQLSTQPEHDVYIPRGESRKKKYKQSWKQILLNYFFFWIRWFR